jgi:hypothetical protein
MQRHSDAESGCLTAGLVEHAVLAVETVDMMSRLSQKDRQTAGSAAKIDDRCRRVRQDRREQSNPSIPDRRVAQAVVRLVVEGRCLLVPYRRVVAHGAEDVIPHGLPQYQRDKATDRPSHLSEAPQLGCLLMPHDQRGRTGPAHGR